MEPIIERPKLQFRDWKFSCDIPVGRQGAQPMQNNNDVYFYSGRVANTKGQYRTYAADFWKLDLEVMLWSVVELNGSYPPPCMNYSVAVWGGAAYLFGGCGDDGIYDALYRFEFASGFWTRVEGGGGKKGNEREIVDSQFLGNGDGSDRNNSSLCWPSSRHAHTAVTFGDAMYVFGGSSRNAQKIRVDYNDVWRFDFLEQSWSLVSANPNLSSAASLLLCPTTTNTNDSTDSCTTTRLPSSNSPQNTSVEPRPRSYHSAVTAGEFMFVFGGFWMEGTKEFYFNDSWVFSFILHSWRRLEEREIDNLDQTGESEEVTKEKARVKKQQEKIDIQQNKAVLNKQQKKQLQQQQLNLEKMQKDLLTAQQMSRIGVPR
jgi:N-acetylneuraminic acid mutarotase